MNTLEQNIFLFMQDFVLRAGKIALARQAGVKNVGKTVRGPILLRDSEGGAAKTVVDEMIQELFLAELYARFPHVRINVEEDTPLVNLFPLHGNFTVHLDPVDGTLSYVQQKKTFSVGMAISDKKNRFTHSVIYAPALGRMYTASPEGCAVRNAGGVAVEDALPLKDPTVIYEKRVLSPRGERALERLGFRVDGVSCAHLAIIDVALGHAAAFLYGLSNPHDSLVPYAFAHANGVEPTDVRGVPLKLSSLRIAFEGNRLHFERIPSVCYTAKNASIQKAIWEVLAESNNLHSAYRALL